MKSLKIGVMVESFRLGLKSGIDKAAEIGAQGVQIYATQYKEMDPDNLTKNGREELRYYIQCKGLQISAICYDLGGHGFEIAEDNNWKVAKSKKILDMAYDLGTKIVTTHIGVLPEDTNSEKWKTMQETCLELGKYAQNKGMTFAVETGPEKSVLLKKFLDAIESKGMAVNFDPANLVMVTDEDPVRGVYTLKDYIVHTHAKDGILLKKVNPKVVYDYFAEGGIEDIRLSDYFKEVPLGEGAVDFPNYIKALKEIGYDGFYTIEREVGDNPVEDIVEAIKFLDQL